MSNLDQDPANDPITTKEFRNALGGPLQRKQKQLLLAHYHAPNHTITTRELALAGGYSISGVNGAYGQLAKKIAQLHGYDRPKGYTWTSFLGRCLDRRPGDGFVWRMHPALTKAIEALRW